MDPYDEDSQDDEEVERGSDELLSADHLRLPPHASPLVRLHAIRAWLTRRQRETDDEIGEAALAFQNTMKASEQDTRLRRRERELLTERLIIAQQKLDDSQQRKQAYEEAEALLTDAIDHTTSNERTIVEYYLALEDLVQDEQDKQDGQMTATSPRQYALMDVQHRVEHVGAPNEE
jgi:hypothetical protein